MKNKTVLLLILFFLPLKAQSFYDLSGYVKYMFTSIKYPRAAERFEDHLLHSRFNLKLYPAENFSAAAELRTRFFAGDTKEYFPNYYDLIRNKYEFAHLDIKLWENRSSLGYAEMDRLWLDYNGGNFEITAGRQRIAWGTSWVWNPTDLFNPLSVLDFDYEERPAADALRIQYYFGPVSKIEFAYKPSKTNDYTAAGLLTLNAFDYDFNILGGIRNQRWTIGGGWTGDIADAGFRGEILISKEIPGFNNPIYDVLGLPNIEKKKTVVSWVLSGDYTFPSSFYVHTEMLYNNVGVDNNTLLYQQEALNAGLLTAARLSIYQEFSYDISPLVRGSVFTIYNPNDKSVIFLPSLTYSIVTNLDLYLLAIIADGTPMSEYGEYGKSFIGRIKFSW